MNLLLYHEYVLWSDRRDPADRVAHVAYLAAVGEERSS